MWSEVANHITEIHREYMYCRKIFPTERLLEPNIKSIHEKNIYKNYTIKTEHTLQSHKIKKNKIRKKKYERKFKSIMDRNPYIIL